MLEPPILWRSFGLSFTLLGSVRERDYLETLSYHSWVIPNHKCLYIAAGKNACTRIKTTMYRLLQSSLADYDDCSDRDIQLHVHGIKAGQHLLDVGDDIAELALTSEEWIRFCFVRNPFVRLYSAFQDKILRPPVILPSDSSHQIRLKKRYQDLRAAIRERSSKPGFCDISRDPADIISFDDFLEFFLSTKFLARDPHFCIQHDLLMPDIINYSIIGRVETFAHDFLSVLKAVGAPERLFKDAFRPLHASTVQKEPIGALYSESTAHRIALYYKKDFEFFGYPAQGWKGL